MDLDINDVLMRRLWVRENFEWLMGEVIFHREMKPFFKNEKISVWKLDAEEGKAKLYENAQ